MKAFIYFIKIKIGFLYKSIWYIHTRYCEFITVFYIYEEDVGTMDTWKPSKTISSTVL